MAFTACEMVFKCTQVDANAGVLQYGMLLEEILMLIDVSDHGMQISMFSAYRAMVSMLPKTSRKTASFFSSGCHEIIIHF